MSGELVPGRLVIEDEFARCRTYFRLARLAALLEETLSEEDRDARPVSMLWAAERRRLSRLAESQGKELLILPMITNALRMPLDEWIAGAPKQAVLVLRDGRYAAACNDYIYSFPRLFLGRRREIVQGRCALVAATWTTDEGQEKSARLWEELTEAWRKLQSPGPAASMEELLIMPVSWWLAGGIEECLLEERREQLVATSAAIRVIETMRVGGAID